MNKEIWTTKDGNVLEISEMETSHIVNCINFLKKRMDEAESEDDETLVSDHWSLPECVTVPGKRSIREKISVFKRELTRRSKELPEINN